MLMGITISPIDAGDGQFEIEQTSLPYSDEKPDSVATTIVRADELKCAWISWEIMNNQCQLMKSVTILNQ